MRYKSRWFRDDGTWFPSVAPWTISSSKSFDTWLAACTAGSTDLTAYLYVGVYGGIMGRHVFDIQHQCYCGTIE